jgi:uncharacterized cofD-like protein
MDNHAVGNLLLTALWDRELDPVKGLERVGQLLKIVGKVLPMAIEPLDIQGKFTSNSKSILVRGQIEVAAATGQVSELRLIPDKPKATPQVITSLVEADWITFGPGSWLSSVMPHFLLAEQAAHIQASAAKKIMIFNLPDKTTSDEFAGFSLEAHLQLVLDHLPDLQIDVALIDKSLDGYEPKFSELVAKCGGKVMAFDLADSKQKFHHDRGKLSSAFAHIFG